jgi:hypothetical protein
MKNIDGLCRFLQEHDFASNNSNITRVTWLGEWFETIQAISESRRPEPARGFYFFSPIQEYDWSSVSKMEMLFTASLSLTERFSDFIKEDDDDDFGTAEDHLDNLRDFASLLHSSGDADGVSPSEGRRAKSIANAKLMPTYKKWAAKMMSMPSNRPNGLVFTIMANDGSEWERFCKNFRFPGVHFIISTIG